MFTLHLQWDGHRGPDAIGQHKLTFTMDESVNSGEFNPMQLKKGAQFMVIFIPAEEGFQNESMVEARSRFMKRMHALIDELAEYNHIPKEEYKEQLKKQLITEGHIKQSTTELDLEGLANVINLLIKRKNEINNRS